MTKLISAMILATAGAALILAACAPAPAATALPSATFPTGATLTVSGDGVPAKYAPDAVAGEIVSAGSSTVFPLSERMKQRFEEEGFTGNITVDSIGSGAGFERFCKAGETDISNASRAIKDSEVEFLQGHWAQSDRIPDRYRRACGCREFPEHVCHGRDTGRTGKDLFHRKAVVRCSPGLAGGRHLAFHAGNRTPAHSTISWRP